MIFLNDSVRREFHLLDLTSQSTIQEVDRKLQEKGLEIKVLYVDEYDIALSVEYSEENKAQSDSEMN
jgi:hypothetical protein